MRWPRIRKGTCVVAATAVVSLMVIASVPAAASTGRAIQPAGQLRVLNFGSHAGHPTGTSRVVAHNPTIDLAAHRAAKARVSRATQPTSGTTTATPNAALF